VSDEFEQRIARSLRSAGRTVVPSPTGYLQIRDRIETRAKRVRRVARVAVSSMSVLVVTVIGILIATGGSGSRPVETASPEGSGIPGYSPVEVPAGMQVVQVVNHDAGEGLESEYLEVYRSAGTDRRIVVRQRPPVPYPAGESSLLASGPLLAEISVQADGSSVMAWLSESGREHQVSGWGVSDEELRLVARDIDVRDGLEDSSPIELPPNMALVAQGERITISGDGEFKQFTLKSEDGAERQLSIEVTIRSGTVLDLEIMDAYAAESEWVDDTKLLVREGDEALLVLWSPSPELLIETRTVGLEEAEVLDFVEMLQPVEDAAWSDLLSDGGDEQTTTTEFVLAAMAEVAGRLDGHNWRLVWPTDTFSAPDGDVAEEDSAIPLANLDPPALPEAETVEPPSDSDGAAPVDPDTPTTAVSSTDDVAETETTVVDDVQEPVSTESVEAVEPEHDPGDVETQDVQLGPESCLQLLLDSLLVEERCDLGSDTRVRAFQALDRVLLVAYNPVGELWLGNPLAITSDVGVVEIEPDATAKGYVWMAWIEASEILSVTQLQLDGTVVDFPLAAPSTHSESVTVR
jgi:hypothetical protein